MKFPKPTWKRSLLVITASLLIVVISFVVWASTPSGALLPEALAALEDDAQVSVTQAGWIEFVPAQMTAPAGFIFYPGGRVQAEAYAPLARAVAQAGYYAAIVYPPLNLAFFDIGAARAVMDAQPQIVHWAVAGHSLGGVAATSFAAANPDVQGLVIMASFPGPGIDLSERRDLSVASIYGSLDGLAQPDQVEASAPLLPPDARFVRIEGGNHAYFGAYGAQAGDNEASISREEQLAQMTAAVLEILQRISGINPDSGTSPSGGSPALTSP